MIITLPDYEDATEALDNMVWRYEQMYDQGRILFTRQQLNRDFQYEVKNILRRYVYGYGFRMVALEGRST